MVDNEEEYEERYIDSPSPSQAEQPGNLHLHYQRVDEQTKHRKSFAGRTQRVRALHFSSICHQSWSTQYNAPKYYRRRSICLRWLGSTSRWNVVSDTLLVKQQAGKSQGNVYWE